VDVVVGAVVVVVGGGAAGLTLIFTSLAVDGTPALLTTKIM
jgi:hypothetical protein